MLFANEAIEKTLFYPSILGTLVVIAAVIIFFGSTYLLLATNLGSRTGFQVTISVFSGVLFVLSSFWVTSAFPLNTLKGRLPEWDAVEVVKTLDKSKINEVKTIESKGKEVSGTEFTNIKASADTLLAPVPEGQEVPKVLEGKQPSGDFIVETAYIVGGSKPNILAFELRQKKQFAVAKFCLMDVKVKTQAFREVCDTSKANESGYLVLEYNHGSLRVPPYAVLIMSLTLFALSLYILHKREKAGIEYSDDVEVN